MNSLINIKSIIELMKQFKSKDKMSLLFVYFSSAYITVNRSKLYDILIRKNILDSDEVNFLNLMQNMLYFKTK